MAKRTEKMTVVQYAKLGILLYQLKLSIEANQIEPPHVMDYLPVLSDAVKRPVSRAQVEHAMAGAGITWRDCFQPQRVEERRPDAAPSLRSAVESMERKLTNLTVITNRLVSMNEDILNQLENIHGIFAPTPPKTINN